MWIVRVIMFLVVLVLLAAAYLWAAMSWSYSSGERAGWVQKFSNKGWLCKTWEGELTMVSMPGAAPEKFYFTVHDDRIAQQLVAGMGQRMTLHYEQKVGLPTSCFGDTRYFVTRATVADSIPLGPGLIVPTPGAATTAPAPAAPAATGAPAATAAPVSPAAPISPAAPGSPTPPAAASPAAAASR